MNSLTVTEAELLDFAKNSAVKQIKIVQSSTGSFNLVINLTWKEGDLNLVTTRKTVREWMSLDRLARHIRENYAVPPHGTFPFISLSLYQHQLEQHCK